MKNEYMKKGKLRQYLQNMDNFDYSDLPYKLGRLSSIAHGLNKIHKQGLIHRDFHAGNILGQDPYRCCITDLGLCRPVNEEDNGEIYGVLPYVAPEVLRGQPYTQDSDIYSFGIVSYEVLS